MPHPLFQPTTLGSLKLANRIVMAPLTRNRANLDGDTPHAQHVRYYRQRAGAGLIISEGAQISPEGKGYFRTPGIYSKAQVAAWQKVTDAVHDKGGKIYCQLWHCGRISHTQFQPGKQAPVAPSAIKADAQTYAEGGMVYVSKPRALKTDEIPRLVEDYAHAAQCAKDAGFDGVELHAANGYLLDQFLRDASNQRDDQYGGSDENRARIIDEVLQGLRRVWDGSQIGIRLSPFSHAGGSEFDDPIPTYLKVVDHANASGLGYIHMVEGETGGDRTMSSAVIKMFRDAFDGVYIANNGYDRDMAMKAVEEGTDLICFGVPFIANPDLPERLKNNADLNEPNSDTFYGGGFEGYTDYPFLKSA